MPRDGLRSARVSELADTSKALEAAMEAKREAEEEVAFWKAETLECRNVLADVMKDRGELDIAAIRYHHDGEQIAASTHAYRHSDLLDAAVKFAKSHARAEAKQKQKMKRGKR